MVFFFFFFFKIFGATIYFVARTSAFVLVRDVVVPATTRLDAKYYNQAGEPIKPALSAYLHFCADARPRATAAVKEEMGASFQPKMVMVRLGQMWKSVDSQTAALYKSRADGDKERYQAQLVAAGISPIAAKKKKKKTMTRARSGYLLYCNDRRPALTADLRRAMGADFKATQVMKQLGAEWKTLDPARKAWYNSESAKEAEMLKATKAKEEAPQVPVL